MIGGIKIELTNDDAELFKKFREYQDRFQALLATGSLDMKAGSCTIHFSPEGKIGAIETHYKRIWIPIK